MDFTFDEYGAESLTVAGRVFIHSLEEAREVVDAWGSSVHWTELVLNWFSNAAKPETVVDTSACQELETPWLEVTEGLPHQFRNRRDGSGEFLKIDLLHSTWPPYHKSYWTRAYWAELRLWKTLTCHLALESEWKGTTSEMRLVYTLHSASKLAIVHSSTKVLVFASYGDERHELGESVAHIRTATGDHRAPWLLIDVPWDSWRDAAKKPAFAVLSRDESVPRWELPQG